MTRWRAAGRVALLVMGAIGLCPLAPTSVTQAPAPSSCAAESPSCPRCPSSSCPAERDTPARRPCASCVAEPVERETLAGQTVVVTPTDERPLPNADGVRVTAAHRREQVLGASPPVQLLVVTFRC